MKKVFIFALTMVLSLVTTAFANELHIGGMQNKIGTFTLNKAILKDGTMKLMRKISDTTIYNDFHNESANEFLYFDLDQIRWDNSDFDIIHESNGSIILLGPDNKPYTVSLYGGQVGENFADETIRDISETNSPGQDSKRFVNAKKVVRLGKKPTWFPTVIGNYYNHSIMTLYSDGRLRVYLDGANSGEIFIADNVKDFWYNGIGEYASGSNTYALLKNDNSLYLWGNNDYGVIGDGTTSAKSEPTLVLNDVKDFGFDGTCSYAVKLNGDLYTWGKDSGARDNYLLPTYVTDNVAYPEILTHYTFSTSSISLVLKSNGELYYGTRGDAVVGTGISATNVVWDKAAEYVISVFSDRDNLFILKSDGSLYGAYKNGGTIADPLNNAFSDTFYDTVSMPLGITYTFDSSRTSRNNPITIDDFKHFSPQTYAITDYNNKDAHLVWLKIADNVKDAKYNDERLAVIKNDNSLWMCGRNDYGQCGIKKVYNDSNDKNTLLTLTKVMDNVVDVVMGQSEFANSNAGVTTILKTDGSLWKFGQGPLGNGTNDDSTDPIKVLNNVKIPIKVKLDAVDISFDQQPIIDNGRTLVPLRAIFEALGAKVEWDGATQTITAIKDNNTVMLTIGLNDLTKNGKHITLDVPAKIINGRTFVPVRAISEAFGAKVEWDGATQTVKITE